MTCATKGCKQEAKVWRPRSGWRCPEHMAAFDAEVE